VLPSYTGVNFMHTNAVFPNFWPSLRVVDPAVEVADRTKTVTAQCQVVGCVPHTTFPEIVGTLSVKWRPGISVRDSHLSKCQSIEDRPSIIANIAENNTFSPVEIHVKFPLLP
jgi:hypothetical protein